MAKSTSIEWTDHTFNPWWGCTKISPGCDHCYAEGWARRVGESVWGHKQPRRFFRDSHWHQPRAWNAAAAAKQQRRRVFCASMADVFEDRRDLDAARERLWKLIADTPHLDWQLLTKRPQTVHRLAPWGENWPTNVWLGTTVEDQDRADVRLPISIRSSVIGIRSNGSRPTSLLAITRLSFFTFCQLVGSIGLSLPPKMRL